MQNVGTFGSDLDFYYDSHQFDENVRLYYWKDSSTNVFV